MVMTPAEQGNVITHRNKVRITAIAFMFYSRTLTRRKNVGGPLLIQFAHRQHAPNWIDLECYSTAGKRCRVRHRAATLVTHTDESLTDALAHP